MFSGFQGNGFQSAGFQIARGAPAAAGGKSIVEQYYWAVWDGHKYRKFTDAKDAWDFRRQLGEPRDAKRPKKNANKKPTTKAAARAPAPITYRGEDIAPFVAAAPLASPDPVSPAPDPGRTATILAAIVAGIESTLRAREAAARRATQHAQWEDEAVLLLLA